MGMGDDVTFSTNVAAAFTCAAVNSITVEFGAVVDVGGDLLLIAPTVNTIEMTVTAGGELKVISNDPTALIPSP